MLYKKEIFEVNQLTKRFHRDCRRIFAQIREDIQETTLTKEEIKSLLDLERDFRVVEIAANKKHKYYPWRENYSE